MKSSIRVELDFDKNEPFLGIKYWSDSDDLRDRVLGRFLEGWKHGQSKLVIGVDSDPANSFQTSYRIGWEPLSTQDPQQADRQIQMINDFPRRSQVQLMHPLEVQILNLMSEIEKLGADTSLSHAVSALSKAKDHLSDFLDFK